MLSLFYFTLPKGPLLPKPISFFISFFQSMATSTIVTPSSISVRTSLKRNDSWSGNSRLYDKATLTHQQKSNQQRTLKKLATCAQYNDRSGGSGGEFVAGFLLGGALCGTMAYIFAPQIRRSLLNEDEYGFRRAKRPIYYDEGLEKTRQTLNAKISQLNTAIDNVSSRLRGKNSTPRVPVETDPEEATM